MRAFVAALIGFLARALVGIAAALVFALGLALLRSGPFLPSFRIAVLVVGALLLFMAAGGSSPARRTGINDPWLASFAPKLLPALSAREGDTQVSPSALFVLAGLALLVLGATMPV
jgi:hypothetical protein